MLAIYELAARFNARRWFELLDVVAPGQVIYKAMLLTGFRGTEPSSDLLVSAFSIHRDRLQIVANGLRDLTAGASASQVSDRLHDALTLWHPLQDS